MGKKNEIRTNRYSCVYETTLVGIPVMVYRIVIASGEQWAEKLFVDIIQEIARTIIKEVAASPMLGDDYLRHKRIHIAEHVKLNRGRYLLSVGGVGLENYLDFVVHDHNMTVEQLATEDISHRLNSPLKPRFPLVSDYFDRDVERTLKKIGAVISTFKRIDHHGGVDFKIDRTHVKAIYRKFFEDRDSIGALEINAHLTIYSTQAMDQDYLYDQDLIKIIKDHLHNRLLHMIRQVSTARVYTSFEHNVEQK